MSLKRSEHWATREFHDFLLARQDVLFTWGSTDCALFAADGILAMTGVDIASDFRGKYKSERGALATINRVCGGKDVGDAARWCAEKHGLAECGPLLAQRGDLVVLQDAGRLISGLVHLDCRYVVAAGEKGLKVIPIAAVRKAWRV